MAQRMVRDYGIWHLPLFCAYPSGAPTGMSAPWKIERPGAHCIGLSVEVVNHSLAIAFFVVILALIDVLGALGEQGVNEARQLVRGGSDSFGFVQSPTQTTVVGTESRAAVVQRSGGHYGDASRLASLSAVSRSA